MSKSSKVLRSGVLSTYRVLPEIFPQSRLVFRVGYDKEERKRYSIYPGNEVSSAARTGVTLPFGAWQRFVFTSAA
jgi:hypothetical protein